VTNLDKENPGIDDKADKSRQTDECQCDEHHRLTTLATRDLALRVREWV
jgi:hypothetical protein